MNALTDTARKLVQVLSIIDDTHFSGAWRGQVYECRAFPNTDELSVGDVALCHVMPDTTELIAAFWPTKDTLPYGLIIIWSGTRANVPAKWGYCNGDYGTPYLEESFIVGAGAAYDIHDQGGNSTYGTGHDHDLSDANAPVQSTTHKHSFSDTSDPEVNTAYQAGATGGSVPLGQHTHNIAATDTSDNTHDHDWDVGAKTNIEPGLYDHRPNYRAFPYIMHMGADTDIPVGGIVNWHGLASSIPANYHLCDGGGGTPDFTDHFVVCEDEWGTYVNAEDAGADASDLTHSHAPGAATFQTEGHDHTVSGQTDSNGSGSALSNAGAVNLSDTSGHVHTFGFTSTASSLIDPHGFLGGRTDDAVTSLDNKPPYYALCFIQRMS